MAVAASSDFGVSASMMFRRWVPASAPLMPLSAMTPRTVESSSVPPATPFAVPPIRRMASPSWPTEVFVLLDAFAIWSIMTEVSSIERPRALDASVTMSEA